MQRPVTYTPTTTQSESITSIANNSPVRTESPRTMAVTTQPNIHYTLPHITGFPDRREPRPQLPPLISLETAVDRLSNSPLTTPPISKSLGYLDPFQRQPLPQSSPTGRNVAVEPRFQPAPYHGARQGGETRESSWTFQSQSSSHDLFDNPLKRPFSIMTQPPPRYGLPPPTHAESRGSLPQFSHVQLPQFSHAQLPPSTRSSYSDASTPSQTQSTSSLMGMGTAQEARAVSAGMQLSRLSLFLRQQPRAARAGPDGKDRRAIDPPPVLQLMIDDFDIDNEDDMNELRSSYFVVHCRLVSATMPKKDLSTTQTLNEDGTVDIQRLLLGTTVASPFFCQDDPDPENMPTHPVTSAAERPPSPSSRFIQSRSQAKGKEKTQKAKTLPGSFFIFADLSVRKAGEYRLEFCLMKIEASSMIAGKNLPIVHTVHSQVFKVVNAKDFDQVQPSTELVKGLLDRGAGFPLKLKKGIREGQRRRQTQGESDDDDDDEDIS